MPTELDFYKLSGQVRELRGTFKSFKIACPESIEGFNRLRSVQAFISPMERRDAVD